MPTYQYACTNAECANKFELVQSFTDPAASACPICASAVRKVYGSVGVVFKGSGFYRNDSRKAAESGAKAQAEGKSSDSKATDGKSDAKPAAKSSEPASVGSAKSSGDGASSSSGSAKNPSASGKAAASS
jgi:putative FmdB family regulatory protein